MDKKLKLIYIILILILAFNSINAQELSLNLFSDDAEDIQDTYIQVTLDSLYRHTIVYETFIKNPVNVKVPDSLNQIYLKISHVNYYPVFKKIRLPQPKPDTIMMYRIANKLEEIVIQGSKKTKLAVNGNVATLKPGKIMERTDVDLSTMLKSVPDVMVSPTGISIRGQALQKIYLHMSPNSPGIEINNMDEIDIKTIEKILTYYNEREIHIYKKQLEKGYELGLKTNINRGKKTYFNVQPSFSYLKNKTAFWFDSYFNNSNKTMLSNSKYKVQYNNELINLNNIGNFNFTQELFKIDNVVEHYFDSNRIMGIRFNINRGADKNDSQMSSSYQGNINESFSESTSDNTNFSTTFYYKTKWLKNWDLSVNTGALYNKQNSLIQSAFMYNTTQGNQLLVKNNASYGLISDLKLKRNFVKGDALGFTLHYDLINANTDIKTHQQLLTSSLPDTIFSDNLKQSKLEFYAQYSTKLFKKYVVELKPGILNYQQIMGPSNKKIQKSIFNPSITLQIPLKKKVFNLFANKTVYMVSLDKYLYNTQSQDGFTNNENNQELKPPQYYQFGVSTSLFNKLYATLSYTKAIDAFIYYPVFSVHGAYIGSKQINMFKNNQAGLNLFYSDYFSKKLYYSGSLSVGTTEMENKREYPFKTEFLSFLTNQSFYYSISDHWSLNMDLTYRSGSRYTENLNLKSWLLLNLSTSLKCNDYITFKLNITDPFKAYRLDMYPKDETITYSTISDLDFRTITFSVDFHFNRKFNIRQKTKEATESLNKRLKMPESSLQK